MSPIKFKGNGFALKREIVFLVSHERPLGLTDKYMKNDNVNLCLP